MLNEATQAILEFDRLNNLAEEEEELSRRHTDNRPSRKVLSMAEQPKVEMMPFDLADGQPDHPVQHISELGNITPEDKSEKPHRTGD